METAPLTIQQSEAILEIGAPAGWASDVGPDIHVSLAQEGLVKVDDERHVVLTESGQRIYRTLKPKPR